MAEQAYSIMHFVYLLIVCLAIPVIMGRLLLPTEKSNNRTRMYYRLIFITGVFGGIVSMQFIKQFTWWETVLQLLTVIGGSFVGSVFISVKNKSLIEDYDESINQQTEYFTKLFKEKHYPELKEPHLKRLTDLVLSILALLLLSPLFYLICLIIWFEDPGSILFSKHVVGKAGYVFREYKFRTMIEGCALGEIEDQSYDQRVLVSGRLLRNFHLDELPQFFNILKGEMSLVGPRPLRTIDEVVCIQEVPSFMIRHEVLPGIAGLAQIRSGYYANSKTRFSQDLSYIQHRNFRLDMKILAVTFWRII